MLVLLDGCGCVLGIGRPQCSPTELPSMDEGGAGFIEEWMEVKGGARRAFAFRGRDIQSDGGIQIKRRRSAA